MLKIATINTVNI